MICRSTNVFGFLDSEFRMKTILPLHACRGGNIWSFKQ